MTGMMGIFKEKVTQWLGMQTSEQAAPSTNDVGGIFSLHALHRLFFTERLIDVATINTTSVMDGARAIYRILQDHRTDPEVEHLSFLMAFRDLQDALHQSHNKTEVFIPEAVLMTLCTYSSVPGKTIDALVKQQRDIMQDQPYTGQTPLVVSLQHDIRKMEHFNNRLASLFQPHDIQAKVARLQHQTRLDLQSPPSFVPRAWRIG